MYAVYHEHFEIVNWDRTVRVTCICGNDFIWSVEEGGSKSHRCPACNERWILGLVGGNITLTRQKTGAKVTLTSDKTSLNVGLIDRLFRPDKHPNCLTMYSPES